MVLIFENEQSHVNFKNEMKKPNILTQK